MTPITPDKPGKPESPVKVTKRFLSRNEADPLFRALEAGHWDTLTAMYNRPAKRKTVTYYEGDENAANKYMNKFGNKGSEAIPYTQAPEELRALRETLRRKYNLEFSLCYINYYKDNSTQIGWHQDGEEAKSPDPLVMVCLGGTRTFSIWTIEEGRDPEADWEEITECGDLVEMPKGFHAKGAYKHAVLPQNRFAGPRISLTFRNPDLTAAGPWGQKPQVYDCHAGKKYPPDAVYVGCKVRNRKGGVVREGTSFGNATNPLISHKGWLKSEKAFRGYAEKKMQDAEFRKQVEALRGKDLLCWCIQDGPDRAPFCHARVWLELANGEPTPLGEPTN